MAPLVPKGRNRPESAGVVAAGPCSGPVCHDAAIEKENKFFVDFTHTFRY